MKNRETLELDLKNASTEDMINDLAQLIKHASRMSSDDFDFYMKNVDPRKKSSIDMFVGCAILLMKQLKENGELPNYEEMLEEQSKLFDIQTENVGTGATFYARLFEIFNDKNK